MALRSLGSSLVAKGGVGGKYRDLAEQNIQQQPSDKGQIGSISRSQVEEPLNRSTPAGSNKVIASKPIVEAAFGEQSADLSNQSTGLPSTPSVIPGIGLGPTPASVGGVVRPATPVPKAPVQQSPQLTGIFAGQQASPAAPNPSQPVAQIPQTNSPTPQQGQVLGASTFNVAPSRNIAPRLPSASGVTGGRAIVDLRSQSGTKLRSGAFA